MEGAEKIRTFIDLEAWQVSHELVLQIYKLTNSFPQNEQFGITSQLRRAVSSITANIAEGFARYHYKDKTRFYYQARGSAFEVLNFTILAKDLGFITESSYKLITEQISMSAKLINGLVRSVENQQKVSV